MQINTLTNKQKGDQIMYQITLEQLDALALCISNMDGKTEPKNNKVNAGIAHGIISEVLGNDATKLYAPIEDGVN